MSRYVGIKELKQIIYDNVFGSDNRNHINELIDSAPSIDICFCKDCVNHNTHRCHMAFDLVATEDDDFCSYGEREGE